MFCVSVSATSTEYIFRMIPQKAHWFIIKIHIKLQMLLKMWPIYVYTQTAIPQKLNATFAVSCLPLHTFLLYDFLVLTDYELALNDSNFWWIVIQKISHRYGISMHLLIILFAKTFQEIQVFLLSYALLYHLAGNIHFVIFLLMQLIYELVISVLLLISR